MINPISMTEVAAWVSLISVAVSSGALLILHVIKTELDPSWRMVSEYAIGPNGWLMAVVFLALAMSCFATTVAVFPYMHGIDGHLGVLVLILTGLALTGAAVFPTDPITTPAESFTRQGQRHGMAAAIGIPGFAIAITFISWCLARDPAWDSTHGLLASAAFFVWLSLVAMVLVVMILLPRHGGAFGPKVWIGWPNRLVMISYYIWLSVAAAGCLEPTGDIHFL